MYVNFVESTVEDGNTDIVFPKTYDWIYVDNNLDLSDDLSFGFTFGLDDDGNDIYAARVQFNGDLIPGYYVPSKRTAVVPWGFQSHCITEDIELLDVSNDDAEYKWIAASNGGLPENAFASGNTVIGDILYTARAKHKGKLLYGKLHMRYNQAYMPYKDQEVSNSDYEVLVRLPREKTTSAATVNHNRTENDDNDIT